MPTTTKQNLDKTTGNLEAKLLEINKNLPKLPETATAMIAKYLWVAATAGVIFGVMGILAILGIGSFSAGLVGELGFMQDAARMWGEILFGVVGMAAVAVVEFISIKPLKALQHRGWKLALVAAILQPIVSVLSKFFGSAGFAGGMSSLISAIISLALSLYILAQTHEHFVTKKAKVKEAKEVKEAKKAKTEDK